MKKLFVFIVIWGIWILNSYPQPHEQHFDKNDEAFKQKKKEYFNKYLQLTSEEADKFWPVFNDFDNRKRQIISERQNAIHFVSENHNNMSKQEIEEYANKVIASFDQESELIKNYYEKFKKILPVEKVIMIFQAEHSFRRMLLDEMKNNPDKKFFEDN